MVCVPTATCHHAIWHNVLRHPWKVVTGVQLTQHEYNHHVVERPRHRMTLDRVESSDAAEHVESLVRDAQRNCLPCTHDGPPMVLRVDVSVQPRNLVYQHVTSKEV
eukprot:9467549-Pyramimonas_sp.AAC.1